MTLTVAILGRPNVGKSTMFNRLTGRPTALVDPAPGVTRDRREGQARLGGVTLRLVDTAGLEVAGADTLEGRMRAQTERALRGADVALLLVDARAGITPMDRHFADWLRTSPTPIVLVANKCDGRAARAGVLEAYALGLGDPVATSAEHGDGIADLTGILAAFEAGEARDAEGEDDRSSLQLAIVGRPNVGKSTLVNRLLGDERVLTGPEPGVTRDSIAIDWSWRDRRIRLVDTAGLRRRARVVEALEKMSVADARRSIRFAHVVVLLLDGEQSAERQDLSIGRDVADEGRALVIGVNKWDLVGNRRRTLRELRDRLARSLPQVRGIPVVALSALTGVGTGRLLGEALRIHEVWTRRIATGPLNRWLAEAIGQHPPPVVRGRRLKLRYITQTKARPPTFALFTTRPSALPASYSRYLVNGIRDRFDLAGVPIRLVPRKGRNPYIGDSA